MVSQLSEGKQQLLGTEHEESRRHVVISADKKH